MPQPTDSTPIIVGVGQVTEPVPQDLTTASSNADLAAQASTLALQDALDLSLADHIDTLAMSRTFPDSSPQYRTPFGRSNNLPRSVAKRLKANPKRAIYSSVGGNMPQTLINEFAEELAVGKADLVLLAGAEVLANTRVAQKKKAELNWSEHIDGELEDRGISTGNLFTTHEMTHQMILPMQYYALMENARRAQEGLDIHSYAVEMGEAFAALSAVASNNPLAVDQTGYDTNTLITPSEENPLIIWPYTKKLISKDTVNQGAAIVMTTVGRAKKLGIHESKWVYLHGYSNVSERFLLEREKLGSSEALKQGLLGALEHANKTSAEINHFDLYSCFPIVLNESKTILGIDDDDSRSLTQTGGMSFFGGPGNNYAMHGIAALVTTLRNDPGSFGLALANGGWISKISVGVYSTQAVNNWQEQSSDALQDAVDSSPRMETESFPDGEALIDSYTAHFHQGSPVKALVIGRLKHNNKRFYATLPMEDTDTMQALMEGDVIGKTIFVESDPKGNRFAFTQVQLAKFSPPLVDSLKDKYQYCEVKKDGEVLLVSINRPEVGNALHPPANEELDGIFNAFEKDDGLRVAILSGAGERFFCTGNDLKYMAQGKPMWTPRNGFAGITSRTNRVKPIIAMVNGTAMGGGLEIAMAADIIVAADHALFALPEVKVGLFAGAGGVQRLTRQIGIKAAMEMLLTGQPIDADKALRLGLINYSVPLDALRQKALGIAAQVTKASPQAIKCTMRLHNETASFASVDDAVTAPHQVFDELLNSNDFWEGSSAFADKRQPNWIK